MSILAGIDIGGTKCAVSVGKDVDAAIQVVGQRRFPTPASPHQAIEQARRELEGLLAEQGLGPLDAVGISCGGPLDSAAGIVLSPPNLPAWDRIDVVSPLRGHFGVPVGLQNDANAGALAEWAWGAGRGCRSMIFLTFGTGMGAGLILDGRLYEGANGLAGEVGHLRLEHDGPVGYGKPGSFEGFCSGGGIAQLARSMADAHLRAGGTTLYCPTPASLSGVTAHMVGEAARQGDPLALEVWRVVGCQLGRGLAALVDVLNPERIVIGGIYGRQQALLESLTLHALRQEALPGALAACEIVPAALGEQIGNMASLAVALHAIRRR